LNSGNVVLEVSINAEDLAARGIGLRAELYKNALRDRIRIDIIEIIDEVLCGFCCAGPLYLSTDINPSYCVRFLGKQNCWFILVTSLDI
jgi:hypothetical protein